ncbi:MAG: outer membrane lipoprotein carrier protein LolA [Spirochaetes bacterium]|nr:outer membrane lipoprotein carrier protein LolA [Spirochaetota bacterium]
MKKFLVVFLMLCFLAPIVLFTDEDEQELPKITTVQDIVDKMVKKFESIKTFVANFGIKAVVEGNLKKSSGEIKYRRPDTFIMIYKWPKDQIIFSDGKLLKIYIPELNVVGEQRLETQYRSTFFISGKTSLYYLRSKYNFSFAKSNKPIMIGDMPYYVLKLEPKESLSEFKEIKLWVSKYWLIVKAEAETIGGTTITISFNQIKINKNLTEHEFEFNLPVNTQAIINPLLFDTRKE